MAYDVSTLPDYTKVNQDQLLIDVVTGSRTGKILSAAGQVMVDIKSSEYLNIFDTDAVFQAGGDCNFNASGTTTHSQRKLTVGSIKVQEELCPKVLNRTYLQLALPEGSNYTDIVFAQKYTSRKNAKIATQLEKAYWQGDTNSTNGNLNKFDGFLKIIDTAALPKTSTTPGAGAMAINAKKNTGTITSTTGAATVAGVGTLFNSELSVGDKLYQPGNATAIGTILSIASDTALTLAANGAVAVTAGAFISVPQYLTSGQANPFYASPILASTYRTASYTSNGNTNSTPGATLDALLDQMYIAIPEAVLEGINEPCFWMGTDDARALRVYWKNKNNFHYEASDVDVKDGFMIPGTNVMCYPVPGLTGTGRIELTPVTNLFLGTDLKDEEMKYEFFYAQEAMKMRFHAEWKSGTQIAFPDQVVSFLGV